LLTRAGIGVLEATEDNLQIQGTEQSVIDSVWRIAAEKGIVVQSITPARNSLEEVFMNTVREDTDAHQ
jgi:hypothetical protein